MTLSTDAIVPSGMYVDSAAPSASAVSWGAIIAGAAAAAALSLILLILGTGLGLSSVSPWAQEGVSATTFGVSTIIWVTFTQICASGMGGYLAGRLRTRWLNVQTDEVYFRDSAHGFLAWAIASLATAAMLTSAIGSIVGGGLRAGTAAAGVVATTAAAATAGGVAGSAADSVRTDGNPMGYFMDTLMRRDPASATQSSTSTGNVGRDLTPASPTPAPVAEITRIFVNAVRLDAMPAEDVRYVAQVVAQRSGLSQADAEKRVNEVFAAVKAKALEVEVAAREAADKGRKASAYAALWLFISLLVGAFVASLAATFGGRQRDL